MAVVNQHTRRIPGARTAAGALLDSLAGDGDSLWPRGSWPAMRFNQPLRVGARGGHGPIRYTVEAYVPAQWIRFRFTRPRGFDGFHEYTVRGTADGGTVLTHLLAMRVRRSARVTWPVVYRWMHDALVEDSLDVAERAITVTVQPPARYSWYVRLLRAASRRVFDQRNW